MGLTATRTEARGRTVSQTTRWLAYGVLLLVLPAAGWRLAQLGTGGVDADEERLAPTASSIQSLEPSSTLAREEPATGGESTRKIRTGRSDRTNGRPAYEPAIVDNLTASDFREIKKDYSCGLALAARQDCDMAYEDGDAHEACLSLRQYYSYSRHCGYQP